jgi:hypothetical protein
MPANVSVTQDTANPYSESDIAIDPGNPLQIVASSNANNGTTMAQYFSPDGGATWSQHSLPAQAADDFQSDPAVGWTSDGKAWALCIGVKVAGSVFKVRSFRSNDGKTWTYDSDVSGTQTGTDKASLWVDRSAAFKDRMYAIWHAGATAFVSVRNGPGGAWGTPAAVSGTETTFTADGGDIKTNLAGDAFAFWPDAGGQTLRVVKSTDGGATWTALGATPKQIATTFGKFTIKVPAQAARAASGGSTIGALIYITGGAWKTASQDLVFACWHDLAGGVGCNAPGNAPGSNTASACKTRIWFARSPDGGATWAAPVKINDQAGLNDQFFPRMAVDDLTGTIMVVYYDTVNDPGRVNTDLWMQYSTDGGLTWSGAIQVTTAETDESNMPQDNNQQYGDYIGMSSAGGRYFACWTDRRSGNDEQIFGAPLAVPSIRFVFGKSTYSQDEVSPSQQFNPAFFINVDGFTNEALGFNAPGDLNNQPASIPAITATVDPALNALTAAQIATIAANLPSVNNFGPLPILPDDKTLTQELQSFFYPYSIDFPGNPKLSSLFGALNLHQSVLVTLTAGFTLGNVTLTAKSVIELVHGENPFFENLDPANPKAFPVWLSYDLRFFKATPTQSHQLFNAANPANAADCVRYIGDIIHNLNTPGAITNGDTYDNALTQDEEASALEFLPTDKSGNPTYNFAAARVRLFANSSVTINPVRVFFRLFPVQSTSTTFAEVGTGQGGYRWGSDGSAGHKIALLGVQTNQSGQLEWSSIPCFATTRVNLNASADMKTQHDDPNARSVLTQAGAEVDTYFGCWIDLNQQGGGPDPAQNFLAATPPLSQAQWDGPWPGSTSINGIINNAPHQCMVAEIRFDDTPVPTGADPSQSDKLAQRNIAWLGGPNPDPARVMPHPFEVRASSPFVDEVDEILILWGSTPAGSTATFYVPAVHAADVVALANELYPSHRLRVVDTNTIGCAVGQATLIPIPKGVGAYAGLLAVDLPPGIKRGDRYDIVVRQLTKATATPQQPPKIFAAATATAARFEQPFSWRTTRGTFQVTITISTKGELLLPEERLLSWLKWKLEVVPKSLRFYPVLQRYLGLVAGRVGGFGGDPGKIPPSPGGNVPGVPKPKPHHHREEIIEVTGKVISLIYDRFGDFAGFVLLSEHGREHAFRGREAAIEALVKSAWIERTVISVHAERERDGWPTSIVLRRYH